MRIVSILSLLYMAVSCVSAQPAETDMENLVNEYVHQYEAIGSFSGSILVVKNDRILLNKAYGLADREQGILNSQKTKYYLGSNSKIFTATAILILEEKGLLTTDQKIEKFVNGFPGGDKISIHQLLTHTSGIAYDLPLFRDEGENSAVWAQSRSLQEQIDLLKVTPLAAEPGTKVIYSNNNYRLLAHIVERVSGKKFGVFLFDEIFAP